LIRWRYREHTALLHFLEVIGYVERARPRDGKFVGEMLVRPHHVIRGED
jgi:hypothetical protein